MSTHGSRLNRVHQVMRRRQGSPVFEWYGNTLACSHNVYGRRTVVTVGGQDIEADLVLFVRKNLFLTAGDQGLTEQESGEIVSAASGTIFANDNRPWPASGKPLSFCGVGYKVEAVEDINPADPDGKLKLACISETK